MSETTTKRRWPAVMVDLETLGTSAKAAVTEIGAVCFDLETLERGPEFFTRVTLESNGRHERAIEPETLAWWMGLWREAGEVPDLTEGTTLEEAVWNFQEFWENHAEEAGEFWSRGSFDEVILRDAAEPLGGVPWRFWNVRDQRTVTAWARVVRANASVAHSALEDARAQVEQLFACRRARKIRSAERVQLFDREGKPVAVAEKLLHLGKPVAVAVFEMADEMEGGGR